MLYINSSNKLARLDAGTSGQILQLSAGIPAWASQSTFGITVQEGDSTLDTDISTLDFDGADFALTESPENEANIRLADHEINRKAFDDTLRSTTSTSTYTTAVTYDLTLPTPGTWTIEAIGTGRIATDDGANVQVRILVDGASVTTSRSGPTTGGAPITVMGSKSGMTTSPKTISLSFRSVSGSTVYLSNAALTMTAYRA